MDLTKVIGVYAPIFLILMSFAYSIGECKGGVITEDDSPCYIFLPFNATPIHSASYSVSVYQNTTLVYSTTLFNYSTFICGATFNQSEINSYVFQFSNGDSGSINVVEATGMVFFNLLVYLILFSASIIFTVMAHKYSDNAGAPVVFGALGFTIAFIATGMIYSGFSVIKGVTFIFDVNYYFGILAAIIGLYSLLCTINTLLEHKKANMSEEDKYYGRV